MTTYSLAGLHLPAVRGASLHGRLRSSHVCSKHVEVVDGVDELNGKNGGVIPRVIMSASVTLVSDEDLPDAINQVEDKASGGYSNARVVREQGSDNAVNVDEDALVKHSERRSFADIPREGRKYKRRWGMLLILVILNLASGMVCCAAVDCRYIHACPLVSIFSQSSGWQERCSDEHCLRNTLQLADKRDFCARGNGNGGLLRRECLGNQLDVSDFHVGKHTHDLCWHMDARREGSAGSDPCGRVAECPRRRGMVLPAASAPHLCCDACGHCSFNIPAWHSCRCGAYRPP
jgi:hypothetical protein